MEVHSLLAFLFCGCSFLLIESAAVSTNGTCPPPIDRTTVYNFQCIIRTQTGGFRGSDNDIYVNLHDTYGGQTGWKYLYNKGRDHFQPYQLDSFPINYRNIAPSIASVEIKEYYDPNWYLEYLEVFCPSVKIDMRFPKEGLIFVRHETLTYSTQTLCPERGTIANGTVTCSDGTRWGSVCQYSCDPVLYQMKGPDCVHCQQNGTWSAPVNSTACAVIDCPRRNLTNGNERCTDGFSFESTCGYDCDEGFDLEGPNSATCLLTGHWSNELPTCKVVRCLHPEVTNGTTRECTNSTYLHSVCRYSCAEGLALKGSNTSTCQTDGQWLPQPPCCVDEPKPKSDDNLSTAAIVAIAGVAAAVLIIGAAVGVYLWRSRLGYISFK